VFRKKLAIDLGTANTLVWVSEEGIVANEPTVVAVTAEDQKVVAVGEEAKRMLGRTPESLVANRPMREGVIADYQITKAMLRYLQKVTGRFNLLSLMLRLCACHALS
jgi:rod shape-determining protein MreB